MNENKKKIGIIIAVLLVTALVFVGYKAFFSPQGVEGTKQVTIHIINEKEAVDEAFLYQTDYEFLLDLLDEKQEELGAMFETYDFGTMITGMMNYRAEDGKEYFHVSINDEDAMTGPGEIALEDGFIYTFELVDQ